MKKQKKLKFNFVDVIVLLVLLAGATFMAIRLIGPILASHSDPDPDPTPSSDPASSSDPAPEGSHDPDDTEEEDERYIITFYAADVADYIAGHLQEGSQLTDDSLTLDLGTLVDYEIGPAQISSTAADGHMVISDLEGHSSVYLMGRVPGADNGFGVTVDGLKLEIGHSMVVRSREAKFWVVVYDIQKLEDTPYVDSEVPDANYFNSADDEE